MKKFVLLFFLLLSVSFAHPQNDGYTYIDGYPYICETTYSYDLGVVYIGPLPMPVLVPVATTICTGVPS